MKNNKYEVLLYYEEKDEKIYNSTKVKKVRLPTS